MSYSELSVEERATIQIGRAQGFSLRKIACLITRSPSTISRELRRNRDFCGGYSARMAQQQMQARRQRCRPKRKLLPSSERFQLVAHMLRERLSPEQIAGKLRSMNIPSLREATRDVLGGLTEREAKVLRMRFGIDMNTDHTLEEVGKQFDVTRERIRQIEAKALRKLRHPSRSEHLRSFLDE